MDELDFAIKQLPLVQRQKMLYFIKDHPEIRKELQKLFLEKRKGIIFGDKGKLQQIFGEEKTKIIEMLTKIFRK